MNSILTILKTELKPNTRSVITMVLSNFIIILLLYTAFNNGLAQLVPRIGFMEAPRFLFVSIMALFGIVYGIVHPYRQVQYLVNGSGLIDQIVASHFRIDQIYCGKSLVYLSATMEHILLGSIFLAVLMGFPFNLLNFILFLLYMILAVSLLVQIGMICGLVLGNQQEYLPLFILITLALLSCSGFFLSVESLPRFAQYIFVYFPFTANIAGGRDILLHRSIDPIHLIELLVLTPLAALIGYQLLRRKLSQ